MRSFHPHRASRRLWPRFLVHGDGISGIGADTAAGGLLSASTGALKQLRSAVATPFFKNSSLPVVTSSIHAFLRLMESTGESK